MALIKYGGGIVQMSGSIAGNTHARNRYGNYVRARTKPVNPNTALQQAIRSAMQLMTQKWSQDLSAAQRTAWNLYGSSVSMLNRLGEAINLTGFNHFLRTNILLSQIGGTAVLAGPTVFEIPEADPALAVAASEASNEVTITFDDTLAWCDEDGAYMVIYVGSPQNPQINFFAGPWRLADTIDGDSGAPPASTVAIAAPFVLTELQRVFIEARIIRADGRVSQRFGANTFCAA